MPFHFEPLVKSKGTLLLHRSPAMTVVIAVMLGIVFDRIYPLSLRCWMIFATLALIAIPLVKHLIPRLPLARIDFNKAGDQSDLHGWRDVLRSRLSIELLSTLFLLGSCVCLGAAWHHLRWSTLRLDDVSNWATQTGRPVRLEAKVLSVPVTLAVPDAEHTPWRPSERTTIVVEGRRVLNDPRSPLHVSGRLRLVVSGRLEQLSIGDLILVTGELSLPAIPTNPGDFDSREWLRVQGIYALAAAEFPESIHVIGRERTWFDQLKVLRSGVRKRAEGLIATRLSERTSPVAQSLLLGSRVDLDHDLRRAFAESGTLHVLAISGMNVGLLWSWVWVIGRMLRWSPRTLLLVVLIVLGGYAGLTDANPPVVRATLAAQVLAIGLIARRGNSVWNSLALAALMICIWNPSDLFNSGAQLSFLSVGAILVAMRFIRSMSWNKAEDDQTADTGTVLPSILIWLSRRLIESCVVGVAIWIVTSPLIASEFHLISPVGFFLNVILSPLIVVMFWIGYSFLLLGLVSPEIFGWLGIPFEFILNLFLSIVTTCSEFQLGHLYVPAPSRWWLWGFYSILLSGALIDRTRNKFEFTSRAALAWSVLGLALALRSDATGKLSCTVLSVGHGLGILIECPNGKTMVYDAGGMAGGSRVAQVLERAVWASGRSQIDAAVISHADADHFNGFSELIKVIPVQTMLVHRSVLKQSDAHLSKTIEAAESSGVHLKTVADGQSIVLDENVKIEVLHPKTSFQSTHDNANSIVLLIEYAGRRILLTGDLEKEGLHRLLRKAPIRTDVLLAPHHGSLKANPTDLVRWARPERVVVSSSDRKVEERLQERYGPRRRCMQRQRAVRFISPFVQMVKCLYNLFWAGVEALIGIE